MIQVYKYLHNLYEVEHDEMLPPRGTQNTRGHLLRLGKQHSNKQQSAHFFSQQVVNEWNQLLEEVGSASLMNCFKSHLDRLWSDHPLRFYYKSPPDIFE